MKRFIIKRVKNKKLQKRINTVNLFDEKSNCVTNESLNKSTMETKEKIKLAAEILNNDQHKVKKLKKDKSIIERTESSKTIITEDNKELLRD